MDEEGEVEMDEEQEEGSEGEMLSDEEGEEEGDGFVSDVSDEDEEEGEQEVPEAVAISETEEAQVNHERRAESSEVSDVNVDDYGSSSDDYDSDELDPDTTANPHGFVFAGHLDTFQKSRRDRILEMQEQKDREAHRKKFGRKPNSKAIGKKEKIHAKNKPFMMVKKKKIQDSRDNQAVLNQKKSRVRTFLGHFKKAKA